MRWLTLVFFVFLGSIVFLADVGRLPEMLRLLYAFPGGDKVGHFLLMGGLNFLVSMSLPLRWAAPKPVGFLFASGVVTIVVTAEELTQMSFATRTFSLFDLAASYAGIVCFGMLAYRFQCRKAKVVVMPEAGPEDRDQAKDSLPR
jgi:polysaccharide biosynthesis protein VpsQ